ncbi:hypothetical protein LG302_14170 [Halomonas organivorans]
MGMEDRDYYWEDRKRRENKFDKKDVYYYRPKEFRRKSNQTPGKPPNDWQVSPDALGQQWKVLLAFMGGSFITFWAVMVILQLNPDFLWVAYEVTGKVLAFLGDFYKGWSDNGVGVKQF